MLIFQHSLSRGYCTLNQKLACFSLYLKILNPFLQKELKNGIGILVGPVILKLQIKTVKILFWLIIQEPLGLLKF